MPTTYETYNGLIADMRRDRMSLRQIGAFCGVSYERIRQILEEYYPDVTPNGMPLKEAAEFIGINRGRYHHIAQNILGIRSSARLWSPQQIVAVYNYLNNRICPICGDKLSFENPRQRYCSAECQLEGAKYRHRSDEIKFKQNLRNAKWAYNNPEKWREIQRRAVKKYDDKMRRLKQCQ